MTVDCKKKYGKQLQAIKENYRIFDIPYNAVRLIKERT
ncbi:hypothetical protein HMPREF1254_1210 [Prevotella sp. BV3P1]|nr:hypothetical protein HMPREF1254_1210 [Prevotella sp. BV3P1]